MRKQYRYTEWSFGKYRLYIYHNGVLVESKDCWLDVLDEEIDVLELNGYKYGYTEEEVETAKQQYENMLRNII